MITALETCIEILSDDDHITDEIVDQAIPHKHLVFDATGNDHYDLAHCYQEAIQNSDTDSALYWLGKWLTSGEEPSYICRRMLITAFEDCASNPNAWLAAMAACFTAERTGMPECMIPMALATCEMGESERNKSAYKAIKEVMSDISNKATVHVPPELRAGTTGYVKAITKKYLKGWKEDKVNKQKKESLRRKEPQITYAVGEKKGFKSYAMSAGPTPNISEMLLHIGLCSNDCIIEFTTDDEGVVSEREIYKWDDSTNDWAEV